MRNLKGSSTESVQEKKKKKFYKGCLKEIHSKEQSRIITNRAGVVGQQVKLPCRTPASHITVLVQVLTTLLLTRLLAIAPVKAADDGSSIWVLATNMRELDEVSGQPRLLWAFGK